jgi:antirestriction protein ArdC
VRKGEMGSLVVYADTFTRTEIDKDSGKECEGTIPFMKGYSVFNVEQIEGLPPQYHAKARQPQPDPVQRIERAASFFAATGAAISHGGTMACYVVGQDHIRMSPCEILRGVESYYATLAHEATHWTKHRRVLIATSAGSAGAMKATPWTSLSQSLALRLCAPILRSPPRSVTITRLISPRGPSCPKTKSAPYSPRHRLRA